MKKKLAFILAIIMTASVAMTGCGKSGENGQETTSIASQNSNIDSSIDDTSSNESSSLDSSLESGDSTSSKSSEESNEIPVAPPKMSTAKKSRNSYKATDVGNWETYLNDFSIPENFAFTTGDDVTGMTMMRCKDTFAIDINCLASADVFNDSDSNTDSNSESTDSTAPGDTSPEIPVSFQFYIADDNGTPKLYISCNAPDHSYNAMSTLDESDGSKEAREMFSDINAAADATFEFKSYGGTTTVDDEELDVIKAVMTDSHDYGENTEIVGNKSIDVDIYFTKDGKFDSINFTADGEKASIFAIEDIIVHDNNWEEVSVEEATGTMFAGFMMMAMSSGALDMGGEISGDIIEGDLHDDHDEHDHDHGSDSETSTVTETTSTKN